LIQLLAIDKTAAENFEALMALTNLAAMSDTVRYVLVCHLLLLQAMKALFAVCDCFSLTAVNHSIQLNHCQCEVVQV